MNNTRILALDGVHNFRDFGGWTTREGRTVTMGQLFRSGHLSRATPDDLARIDALGLKALADLRQPGERSREPNTLPKNAPSVIFETAHGGYDEAPHLQFLREGHLTVASVQTYMVSAYQRIPMEPHHQQIFGDVFRQLLDGKPLLIHCAAGKDRTGILAALILSAIGVDRQQVMEDYMLTNTAVDIDALLPSIAQRIAEQSGQSVEAWALRPMLGVEAEFLDAAFGVIGPLDHYFEHALGITQTDREALRDKLTLVP